MVTGHPWGFSEKTTIIFLWEGPERELIEVQMPADQAAPHGLRVRAREAIEKAAQRFRICLECQRPFIARKGQEYCTARCSQAVRTRKFRSGRARRNRE